jgi:hypothetical protein
MRGRRRLRGLQLRHVDRIGGLRTGRQIGDLAGLAIAAHAHRAQGTDPCAAGIGRRQTRGRVVAHRAGCRTGYRSTAQRHAVRDGHIAVGTQGHRVGDVDVHVVAQHERVGGSARDHIVVTHAVAVGAVNDRRIAEGA